MELELASSVEFGSLDSNGPARFGIADEAPTEATYAGPLGLRAGASAQNVAANKSGSARHPLSVLNEQKRTRNKPGKKRSKRSTR